MRFLAFGLLALALLFGPVSSAPVQDVTVDQAGSPPSIHPCAAVFSSFIACAEQHNPVANTCSCLNAQFALFCRSVGKQRQAQAQGKPAPRGQLAPAASAQRLVAGMRRHSHHAQAQLHGCLALAYLAQDSPGPVAEAYGVEAITEAMTKHASHASVAQSACAALGMVGPRLLKLQMHAHHARTSKRVLAARSSCTTDPHHAAARTHVTSHPKLPARMRSSSTDDGSDDRWWHNQVAVGEGARMASAGGLAAIVGAMVAHPKEADVVRAAMGALVNAFSVRPSSSSSARRRQQGLLR